MCTMGFTHVGKMDHEKSKCVVVLRGGASLVNYKPVFSFDSKCLFCCCGHVVKVYSTSSGECIRDLAGHTDKVTSVQLNPKNRLQLLSSSLDQTIIQWDYSDGVLLKRFYFSFPVFSLLSHPDMDELLAIQKHAAGAYKLVKFNLPSDTKKNVQVSMVIQGLKDAQKCVAVGCKGEYVAAINGMILTVKSFAKNISKEHRLDGEQRMTCVACHPTEQCVATGLQNGKIMFWWDIFSKHCVKTTVHWHSLPVGDVTFTTEGSYLLSGGHECVLVKWQYNSHHKDFLPRLGAPVNHATCSHDNTLYATCHTDNVIKVISNALRVTQVFQGLTRGHLDHQVKKPVQTGLLVDPRTKALVMNGKPGHLQFYGIHNDRHLFNLDIVCQNYISPENLQRPVSVTEIEQAVFDTRGHWLVTVQRRDDGVTYPESCMKFWEYNEQSQTYTLNTSVDTPHMQQVDSLKMRPVCDNFTSPMMVTASRDGRFKLWELVDDTDIYKSNKCWNCESVGFYKDLPCHDAAFSEDGSILAAGFESMLTLWDPDTNVLKKTLNCDSRIRQICFGCGPCCQYLVSATNRQLLVWDLLHCTLQWSVAMEAAVLTADPVTDHMAVVTRNKDLFVFKPSNSKPVYSQSSVSNSPVVSAVFVPHLNDNLDEDTEEWQAKSNLYFINAKQELLSIQPKQKSSSGYDNLNIAQSIPETPISVILSNTRKRGSNTVTTTQHTQRGTGVKTIEMMTSTPAHVLPPVSSLCATLLNSLLIHKGKRRKSSESEDSDESSEDEEGDDETSDSEDDDIQTIKQTKTLLADKKTNSAQTDQSKEFLQRTSSESANDLIQLAMTTDFNWLVGASKK